MLYRLETDIDALPNEPGVYRLIALNTRGKPKPLSRVGGLDRSGVLYIGRSRKLRSRLRTRRHMLFDGTPRGHIAGLTYRASLPIRRFAPPSRIAFRFTASENDHELERKLLRSYFRKYGEVPPLNGRAEFIVATP
jgi:hypothetical protein